MPSSRVSKSRGSYAKYICINCRGRKIKCSLPQDPPTPGVQKPANACQRCKTKGLTCDVVNTTLGRPTAESSEMTRRTPDTRRNAEAEDEQVDELTVDEYLLAHPQPRDAPDVSKESKGPSKEQVFEALVSPIGMLSMLVSRDRRIGSGSRGQSPMQHLLEVIDTTVLDSLEQGLIWHRFFYPDIPPLKRLHAELSSERDDHRLSSTLLLAVLCRVALSATLDTTLIQEFRIDVLDRIIYKLGQQALFTLPKHRHFLLALELLLEYSPLALILDDTSAPHAVKGDLYKTLMRHVARHLSLDQSVDRLKQDILDATSPKSETMIDCLQRHRIHAIDVTIMSRIPGTDTPSVEEVTMLLQAASGFDTIAADSMYAFYTLLLQVKERESMENLIKNWRDLDHLTTIIQTHQTWCDQQLDAISATLENKSATNEIVRVSRTLLSSALHASQSKITSHAMFFCIVSGARSSQLSSNSEINETVALDTSKSIIDRLTDPTLSQSGHTLFLARHGSNRLEVLERTLLNFIREAGLGLNGVAYYPPTRKTVSEILFVGRDVLEQNAARLKGWGALGDRHEVFAVLMKEVGEILGRTGKGEGMWGLGGRVMKGYVETLKKWERWGALGLVQGEKDRNQTSSDAGNDTIIMDDADFLIDWDSWLNDSPELWEWLE